MGIQVTKHHPVPVGAGNEAPRVVKNTSSETVYYRAEPFVSSATSDGSLTQNQEVTIITTTWFVTATSEAEITVMPGATTLPSLTKVGTGNYELESVTAAKLAVDGGVGAGVWGTSERAPRTSAAWPGAGVPAEQAIALAEVGNFVAVPVVPGDIFKHVAVAAGTKEPEKIKEFITGIYVGETGGALLAQSKSATPTEHKPKLELYASELESTVTITTTSAPHGYVYAFFAAGAFTTNFEAIALTYTTANQAILGKYGTAGVAANAIYNKGGSAIKGTAEAVVPALTAVAGVPIVALY